MGASNPDFNPKSNIHVPCKDCIERHEACWSKCLRYRYFQLRHQKQQKALAEFKKENSEYEARLLEIGKPMTR